MICQNRDHFSKLNVSNKPSIWHLYDSLKVHTFKTVSLLKKIATKPNQGKYSKVIVLIISFISFFE